MSVDNLGKNKRVTTVAVVIVTYKRQDLLQILFSSFVDSCAQPDGFIIIDNENSSETAALVSEFSQSVPISVYYAPQLNNLGGAGGFSIGTKLAASYGFDWIWLMDDDVAIVPGALNRLRFWMNRTDSALANGVPFSDVNGVIQGQRLRHDGSLLAWQNRFLPGMGIADPRVTQPPPSLVAYAPIENSTMLLADVHLSRPMNVMCFEGCIFRSELIQIIGLPDSRFFIAGDDTTYGYLASLVTKPIETNDLVLTRTKPLKHLGLPTKRKMSESSDLTRYYMLRNRGLIRSHLRSVGKYQRLPYLVGTLLSLGAEVVRLAMSQSRIDSVKAIVRGLKDARRLGNAGD